MIDGRQVVSIVLAVIAVLIILTGLLWIGQGTGLVNWPKNSFMVDERPWAFRGALLAAFGIALFWISRRRST